MKDRKGGGRKGDDRVERKKPVNAERVPVSLRRNSFPKDEAHQGEQKELLGERGSERSRRGKRS